MTTTSESYESLLVQVAEAWPELRVPCAITRTIHNCGWGKNCQGRGWLPCRDWDSITAAVRERGWDFFVESESAQPGDGVDITDGHDVIASVVLSDKLRGTHALVLALSRALERQND